MRCTQRTCVFRCAAAYGCGPRNISAWPARPTRWSKHRSRATFKACWACEPFSSAPTPILRKGSPAPASSYPSTPLAMGVSGAPLHPAGHTAPSTAQPTRRPDRFPLRSTSDRAAVARSLSKTPCGRQCAHHPAWCRGQTERNGSTLPRQRQAGRASPGRPPAWATRMTASSSRKACSLEHACNSRHSPHLPQPHTGLTEVGGRA